MLIIFCLSFCLTILAVMCLRPLSIKWDLVDYPGEHRLHKNVIPLIGGLSIFVGVAATLLLTRIGIEIGLLLSLSIVMLFGVLDDKWRLPFGSRLLVQVWAALCLVYVSDIQIRDLGNLLSDNPTTLGSWSVVMTVFSIVGVINSFNMIDGMDGLCGSLILVVLLTLLYCLGGPSGSEESKFLITLIASVCAFLVFNLRHYFRKSAAIFMGDAGSTMFGLIISWLIIKSTQGNSASLSPVTALWLVTIPLFDTVGVMIRRLARFQSPFKADRTHTHHLLMQFGLSVTVSLCILILLSIFFVIIGVQAHVSQVPDYIMFYVFLGMFAVYLMLMEWGAYKLRK